MGSTAAGGGPHPPLTADGPLPPGGRGPSAVRGGCWPQPAPVYPTKPPRGGGLVASLRGPPPGGRGCATEGSKSRDSVPLRNPRPAASFFTALQEKLPVTKKNCSHGVALEQNDNQCVSVMCCGSDKFKNGRKHAAVRLRIECQTVAKKGCALTSSSGRSSGRSRWRYEWRCAHAKCCTCGSSVREARAGRLLDVRMTAPAFSTAFACGTWFAIGESDYICRAIK